MFRNSLCCRAGERPFICVISRRRIYHGFRSDNEKDIKRRKCRKPHSLIGRRPWIRRRKRQQVIKGVIIIEIVFGILIQ